MTLLKPKTILKKEAKEKLKHLIELLEKWGYSHDQIAEVMEDYKQVVSSSKKEDYPISLKKANEKIQLLENFIDDIKKKVKEEKENNSNK